MRDYNCHSRSHVSSHIRWLFAEKKPNQLPECSIKMLFRVQKHFLDTDHFYFFFSNRQECSLPAHVSLAIFFQSFSDESRDATMSCQLFYTGLVVLSGKQQQKHVKVKNIHKTRLPVREGKCRNKLQWRRNEPVWTGHPSTVIPFGKKCFCAFPSCRTQAGKRQKRQEINIKCHVRGDSSGTSSHNLNEMRI